MVFKNLGSAVHNGQDCSSGYEFSENLLKNIAIQVKSSNFRKGKDWKAVMGGLPILISIDDEVFLRGVLSGEEKLNKDDVVIADVKLIQTIEQNKIVNNYRAVNVIEHKKIFPDLYFLILMRTFLDPLVRTRIQPRRKPTRLPELC